MQSTHSVELKDTPVSKTTNTNPIGIGNLNIRNILGGDKRKFTNEFNLYSEIIYQPTLANELTKNKKLMIYVFRTEWDVENKRWKTHKGNISSNIRNLIKKVLGMPIC